jgi:hypothetical protein
MTITKATVSMIKASGVPDSTTYLRGDSAWAAPDGTVSTSIIPTTTKISLDMIDASGTMGTSSYLRGDGVWVSYDAPVWATMAGNIATSNEQASFTYTLVAVDPNGLSITYTISSGSLPSGLTLNTPTGVISGTTPAVYANTIYTFTATANNGTKTTDRIFTITVNNNINEAPIWSTAAGSIGSVNMGSTFDYTVAATDPNSDPITYSIVSGSLPSGLTMSTGGAITGATANVGVTTTSNFTIRATDSNSGTTDRAFSITVVNTTYLISNSSRFRSVGSTYLSRIPSVTGNRQKFTISAWVKRADISTTGGQCIFSASDGTGTTDSTFFQIFFQANSTIKVQGGATNWLTTNAAYRDVGAWYHIVLSTDTVAGTMSLYVNGSQVTSLSTNAPPSGGLNTAVNSAICQHRWGATNYSTPIYIDGYLSDCHLIDGAALDSTNFGKFDVYGNWVPISYVGAYGTNGCKLEFKNSSNLGLDASGNGNIWTSNGVATTDQMIDSPTNNYCTLNPIDRSTDGETLSNGNLTLSGGGSGFGNWRSTMAVTTGKWYFRAKINAKLSNYPNIGIAPQDVAPSTLTYNPTSIALMTGNVNADYQNNGSIIGYTGFTYAVGDYADVAFDCATGKVWFGQNGNWSGNPDDGTGAAITGYSGTWVTGKALSPYARTYSSASVTLDFQTLPPANATSFKTLCTNNLPAVIIPQGSQYMNAVLWSGNSATQSITTGFQPDMLWVKRRNDGEQPAILDSMRGTTVFSSPSTNSAESAEASITGFTTTGFNLGATMSGTYSNTTGYAYMGFAWKKGPTPGFDVVLFNQSSATTTTNHSLGTTPAMIITKDRQGTSTWSIYHKSLSSPKDMYMTFQPGTPTTSTNIWGTGPTSTQFTTTNSLLNIGNNCVAYLWAEVPGFSKFGSYIGNGVIDGVFVYCGFKPRWIFFHDNAGSQPYIFDTVRDTVNPVQEPLLPGGTGLGTITQYFDVLSNGFKFRNGSNPNGGLTYFAAFAELPFGGSNVSPATAR